jgi:hypothetical protein
MAAYVLFPFVMLILTPFIHFENHTRRVDMLDEKFAIPVDKLLLKEISTMEPVSPSGERFVQFYARFILSFAFACGVILPINYKIRRIEKSCKSIYT